MKYRLLLFLFFVSLPNLFAQEWIQGKVIDAENKQPLAFVNIIFQNGGGVNSDIDGNFRFRSASNHQKVVFSYLGYKRDTLTVAEIKAQSNIRLQSNAYKISKETILPEVNPANQIIKAPIPKKKKNNREKATEFSYDSKNKLIFPARPDSA